MPRPSASRRFTKALASFSEVPDPLRAAGATWSAIGSLYGISKQAAQQRFGQGDARTGKGKAKGGS